LQIPYNLSGIFYKIIISSAAILYRIKNDMRMNTILLIVAEPVESSTSAGYLIGALLSLCIFCYLIYSLAKPEKF